MSDGGITTERVYRVLFPFCGVGGGALGFKAAHVEFARLGIAARFEIVGGIEWDAGTARDFEMLTGAPCLCADVEKLTPEMLRAFFGATCPDVIFFSPPCKAASGLLAEELAATPKYRAMSMLGAVWVDLMFATWPEGPRLLIMENVPRIVHRAAEMMRNIRAACRKRRYHIAESSHDLGEVGGLAQHRQRLLFVGRRDDVPTLLYQPMKRRVRSVGEVIGALPLPGDPAAGALHVLPSIEPITALRLALIPAGGDWRDLPERVHLHPSFAALLEGKLPKPSKRTPFNDVWRVVRWDDAAGCVTGGATPTAGGMSVADPRMSGASKFTNNFSVMDWDAASRTIAGSTQPGSGGLSVADPRVGRAGEARADDHGVIGWDTPSGTITGRTSPSNGRFSVADPRTVRPSHPHTYGVLPWDGAAHTITATAFVGCGPFTVADPRITCTPRDNAGSYGVLPWDEAIGCIVAHACHDNGRFTVADPRAVERAPFPVIIAADGTWHRPLTALECAVLQGFPSRWGDGPFTLSGTKDQQRVKIGDAVPPPAAQRIAEQMLYTLVHADAGAFALSSGGGVWVREHQIAGHA